MYLVTSYSFSTIGIVLCRCKIKSQLANNGKHYLPISDIKGVDGSAMWIQKQRSHRIGDCTTIYGSSTKELVCHPHNFTCVHCCLCHLIFSPLQYIEIWSIINMSKSLNMRAFRKHLKNTLYSRASVCHIEYFLANRWSKILYCCLNDHRIKLHRKILFGKIWVIKNALRSSKSI